MERLQEKITTFWVAGFGRFLFVQIDRPDAMNVLRNGRTFSYNFPESVPGTTVLRVLLHRLYRISDLEFVLHPEERLGYPAMGSERDEDCNQVQFNTLA